MRMMSYHCVGRRPTMLLQQERGESPDDDDFNDLFVEPTNTVFINKSSLSDDHNVGENIVFHSVSTEQFSLKIGEGSKSILQSLSENSLEIKIKHQNCTKCKKYCRGFFSNCKKCKTRISKKIGKNGFISKTFFPNKYL